MCQRIAPYQWNGTDEEYLTLAYEVNFQGLPFENWFCHTSGIRCTPYIRTLRAYLLFLQN